MRSRLYPPLGLATACAIALAMPAFISATTLAAPPAKSAEVKRPSKQYTIEQFMASTSVFGGAFSPDEKTILYTSNASGVLNLWSAPVGGGAPRQLTDSKDSTAAVSYFPKDERILFSRDQGGNENHHLFVRELDGKERDITPGDKVKARYHTWSADEKSFYVSTNKRDQRFFDLYRVDAASYEQTLVYQNDTGYFIGDVSRDGKWIAFNKPTSTSDSDVYLLEVDKKELKHITPHQGTASYGVETFDPDSKWLYFQTDDGSEFSRVRRFALATGKIEDVEKADWDIMYTVFSKRGKYRVTAVNADARTVIRVYDAKSGKLLELPKLPEGDITTVRFSPSEKSMLFYVNSDRAPSNLYVYDFATKKSRRLTDTISKEIDPEDLVSSEVVRFKSFDGMEIPSLLYKPHQASAAQKAPAVVFVHGGPGGQSRKGFSEMTQYLVNHGYVILAINNRGSSGYGKTFFKADDQKHGREPLWDCVEAKKYLAGLPYVDGGRVGIMGGSYGGYMTLAALAFQPDVFNVGVDIFGVANWVRTLESIPPYWKPMQQALFSEMGDPATQKEMLMEISPLFHADKIRRPLLVLQGANDPRVLKVESDEIVAALKKNGVPVQYIVFDDEGHGFSKKANQLTSSKAIREFLDQYLKATSSPSN